MSFVLPLKSELGASARKIHGESPSAASRVELFTRIFTQESELQSKIAAIEGVAPLSGRLEEIEQKIQEIDQSRKLHELIFKWAVICPASFCINYLVLTTGLPFMEPLSAKAAASAVGTFGMVFVFDKTDKYWNRFFHDEVNGAITEFVDEAGILLRRDGVEKSYAQEVDFARIEVAASYLDRSEQRERELSRLKDEALMAFIRKREANSLMHRTLSMLGLAAIKDPKVIEAIQKGEQFRDKDLGQMRTQYFRWKLEQAYEKERLKLLNQRLNLIKSLRAKIEFGDTRFSKLRGADGKTCAQMLREFESASNPPTAKAD
jgi:hypothetical protein